MSEPDKTSEKSIRIRRPKRRVHTRLDTGTVVHKTKTTYRRKEKHRRHWQDLEEETPDEEESGRARSDSEGEG